MTINYTTLLGLAQPVTGTEQGTWGDTVNTEITALLEDAIADAATFSVTSGDVTLTSTAGQANQARMAILLVTGTPGVSRNIIAPSQSKWYIVKNSSDASVVLKGSATTGVTILAGTEALCFWNGSDFEIVGVNGPSSSTDNAVVRFDGTTGKVIQNSGVIIDDSNNVSGMGTLGVGAITSSSLTSGRVLYAGTSGLIQDSANLTFNGTTLTANTIGAFTLGGTISGGGNQINNIVIGASTPLAGSFTTLSASGVATFSAGTVSAPAITTTGDTNTGIFFPAADTIAFAEGGAEAMRIDSSGNVGIGVTPSAWRSASKVLQVGTTSVFRNEAGLTVIGDNSYTNSSSQNIYITNGYATGYTQTSGQHQWYTAASGTAGNAITFTQAMTLDASGNLGVGATTGTGKLYIRQDSNSAATTLNIWNGNSSGTGGTKLKFGYNTTDVEIAYIEHRYFDPAGGASPNWWMTLGSQNGFRFVTDMVGTPTERMRIDTSGNVGIGRTPSYLLDVNGTARFNTTIGVGNTAPAASGAGISFPATQSASSDANTLDDYEEGTIDGNNLGLAYGTPGTSSFTYSERRGTYTKIGRVVYFTIDIRLATFSKGTASGSLTVVGLPFAQRNTGGFDSARCTVQLYDWTYTTSPIIAAVASAGTSIEITRMVSNNVSVDIDDPKGSSIIWVTGFYFV